MASADPKLLGVGSTDRVDKLELKCATVARKFSDQ